MNYQIDGQYLTDIANAIRAKTGGIASITPEDMPDEIASISGGGGGTAELTPYKTDVATGYLSGNTWYAYQSGYQSCRSDVYKINFPVAYNNKYFIIYFGKGGDNRLRVAAFMGSDPTESESGSIAGLQSLYRQPAYQNLSNFSNSDGVGAYNGFMFSFSPGSATGDAYLVIAKTNANINGIKTHVIDITDVD